MSAVPASSPGRRRFLGQALAGIALALAGGAARGEVPAADAFDALLHAHVRDGDVDYRGFRASAGFRQYVATLAQPATLPTRDDRIAHRINAYNALAIQGILDGLSPSSFLGRQRYFRLKSWPFDGATTTLHDLEHLLLRPLGEPRIHFALVCASRSCPPLRTEAYVAARLDTQLDDQARTFVNDRTRNRFDASSRTAQLSEIFKWYDEDFRGAGSVQRYLARYVADAAVARDLARDAFAIEWIPYDWRLNGTPPD